MILLLSARSSFAFLFQTQRKLHRTERRERGKIVGTSFSSSPISFSRYSFKILLPNSARYFVVVGKGFPDDKEKEKKREGERENERKRRAFHMAYVIHRVCYLITEFAPVWSSPRRMTEHNGGIDIFKSGEGIRSLPLSRYVSAAKF